MKILISHRIKTYRKKERITQEMMAKLLGVSPQAISKWEREECYPDITFLPTLAAVLSCTVNDFFE